MFEKNVFEEKVSVLMIKKNFVKKSQVEQHTFTRNKRMKVFFFHSHHFIKKKNPDFLMKTVWLFSLIQKYKLLLYKIGFRNLNIYFFE